MRRRRGRRRTRGEDEEEKELNPGRDRAPWCSSGGGVCPLSASEERKRGAVWAGDPKGICHGRGVSARAGVLRRRFAQAPLCASATSKAGWGCKS